jgi:hypothetical protein
MLVLTFEPVIVEKVEKIVVTNLAIRRKRREGRRVGHTRMVAVMD